MMASTVMQDALRVSDKRLGGRRARPGCEENLGLGVGPMVLSVPSATPALVPMALAVLDMPPSPSLDCPVPW